MSYLTTFYHSTMWEVSETLIYIVYAKQTKIFVTVVRIICKSHKQSKSCA